MDAQLKLATSDSERWAYVADALKEIAEQNRNTAKETAEQNKETAVILARISEQLNDHEEQIQDLKAEQQKATERELERASIAEPTEPSSRTTKGAAQQTLAAVVSRIYNDWRAAVLIGTVVGVVIGSHFGLTWHW